MLTWLGQFEVPTPEAIQPVLDALPPAAMIGLGALMVIGLVLWIMGRVLAKAACVISGLLLGLLGGLAVGQMLKEDGAWTLPLLIGGGIAGALLAAVLFRLWMGLVGALIFAMLVPAAWLSWQQTLTGGDDDGAPTEQVEVVDADRPSALEEIRASVEAEEAAAAEAPVDSEDSDAEPDPWIWQQVQRYYNAVVETAAARWNELPEAIRLALLGAAGVGAVGGLIFGLVAPNIAASGLSALLGAILLFYPGRAMAEALAPDQAAYLPHSPGPTLVLIGLLTVAGFVLQWMLFRKRTDK